MLGNCQASDLLVGVNCALPSSQLQYFSHEDPLEGLTQSHCFPLKSRSAAVLLGATQVNISISIESVLFWRSSVFLGSSVLAQLRLGSSPTCTGSQPLHRTPCISPIMENTNKTRVPLLQPSVDLSWDPHRKKPPKQRPGSLFCGKSVRDRAPASVVAFSTSKQTSRAQQGHMQ